MGWSRRTLVVEMVGPFCVNEHAIWIIHEALWRAEVYLWAQRFSIIPW